MMRRGTAFGLSVSDTGMLPAMSLRQWRSLALLVVLCFVASGLAVVQPWPLKLLVDTAFGSQTPPEWLGLAGR